MIDVEQRTLRAFEQDALSLPPRRVEQFPRHIHVRQNLRCDAGQIGDQKVLGDLGLAQSAAQGVVVREMRSILGPSVSGDAKSCTRIARRPTLSS